MPQPTIEKGIPIPPKFDAMREFPWIRNLNEGDSFLLKHNEYKDYGSIKAIYRTAKKFNITVTCRKTKEGYRIWRVAKKDGSGGILPFPNTPSEGFSRDGSEAIKHQSLNAKNR